MLFSVLFSILSKDNEWVIQSAFDLAVANVNNQFSFNVLQDTYVGLELW